MKAVPLNRYIVFFSIAIAGCTIDLATKSWIFSRPDLRDGHTDWGWKNVLGLRTDVNTGALFGMGEGLTPLLAVLSVAAALGILAWLFYAGAAHDRLLCVALGCVMAGVLGNLYDRLGLPGLTWNCAHPLHNVGDPVYAVRDWILVMIGSFHWPNFNLADSMLVCGAILLVWHAFRHDADGKPAENGEQ